MKVHDLLAEANPLDGLEYNPATGTWGPKPEPKPQIVRASGVKEPIENVDIDWEQFKAGMTAAALFSKDPLVGRIDGLVYLGIMGAPGKNKIFEPVRIAWTVDDAGNDFMDRGANARPGTSKWTRRPNGGYVAGEFVAGYGSGWYRGNSSLENDVISKYDIVFNHISFNPADISQSAGVIAHELRHRGFHMIRSLPEILDRIPQPYRDWAAGANGYNNTSILDFYKFDNKDRQSQEHLLMYSVEMADDHGQVGPLDKLGDSSMFRSVDEVRTFRKIYWIIANAARDYIQTQPIPKGGLKALRDEVDKLTPDNEKITITKAPGGKVEIIATSASATPAAPTQPSKGPAPAAPNSPVSPTGSASPDAPRNSSNGPATSIRWQDIYGLNRDLIGPNSNLIKPGQRLKMPNNMPDYTVQPGDYLSKIAKAANELSSELALGQRNREGPRARIRELLAKAQLNEQDSVLLARIKQISFH